MNAPWHLVQVCNVGTILGGTGACALTITQALPDWRHTILCFSRITPETRIEFQSCSFQQIAGLSEQLLRQLSPDFVVYHNTRRERVEAACLNWPSLYYLHSHVELWHHVPAVACSEWLANCCRDRPKVMYQPIPEPPFRTQSRSRSPLGEEFIVGRICTPVERKWPRDLIPFYAKLAMDHPHVRWEFVGCPSGLQADLKAAVNDRVAFYPAAWSARRHFWNWDVLLYHHSTITESFGRVVAESLRAGCIPVVDQRGGFCEQIRNGTGVLCQTTQDFSMALSDLRDPAERIRRSRRCRSWSDEFASLSAFRRRFFKHLCAIV